METWNKKMQRLYSYMGRSALMFYWIESAQYFDPSDTLSDLVFRSEATSRAILPCEVRFQEGPDPHELTFVVKADPALMSSAAIFPPSASVNEIERRPDGVDEWIAFPTKTDVGSGSVGFKPFQVIKLMSSDDNTMSDPQCKFIGVILQMKLSLAEEEWEVRCFDLVRWYLSKIVYKGVLYKAPNDLTQTWIPNALAIYNEDEKSDQYIDATLPLTPVYEPWFTIPDYRSYKGIPTVPSWDSIFAGRWTLGRILNQLREIYFANAATYGTQDLSKIMNWPEVVAGEKWDFLLELDGEKQEIMNFAIGGLTLNECIDAIVRKAGRYTWNVVLDPVTLKHDLHIYSLDTGDEDIPISLVSLTRGMNGDVASAEPQISEGLIGYDWSNCSTEVFAIGEKEQWEITLGYGASNTEADPSQLTPAWTTLEQDNYQVAEKAGDDVEKYTSVFTKFKIKNTLDWELVLPVGSRKKGPREILSELLTEDTNPSSGEDHRKIKARIFRWDPSSNAWSEATEEVSLVFDKDMTISVHGFDPDDDVIQNAKGKRVFPRYLCNTEDPIWAVFPFRLTISVEDDTRLVGTKQDVPASWPNQQSTVLGVKGHRELRFHALHGTKYIMADFVPAQNDYTDLKYVDPLVTKELHSDQHLVDVTSYRSLKALSRPECRGTLTLPAHEDLAWFWDMNPGMIIDQLIGGAIGTFQPLPTIQCQSLVRSITYIGLAVDSGGQRRAIVELGEM